MFNKNNLYIRAGLASHVAYYFSDASPQSFFALFSRVIDVSRHASSCFKYAIKNWTRHKFQRSASTPPPGGHPLYPFIFQPNRRSILAVNLTPPCPVFRDWSTVFQCFLTESSVFQYFTTEIVLQMFRDWSIVFKTFCYWRIVFQCFVTEA